MAPAGAASAGTGGQHRSKVAARCRKFWIAACAVLVLSTEFTGTAVLVWIGRSRIEGLSDWLRGARQPPSPPAADMCLIVAVCCRLRSWASDLALSAPLFSEPASLLPAGDTTGGDGSETGSSQHHLLGMTVFMAVWLVSAPPARLLLLLVAGAPLVRLVSCYVVATAALQWWRWCRCWALVLLLPGFLSAPPSLRIRAAPLHRLISSVCRLCC